MTAGVYSYTIHDLKTNVQICDIPLTGVKYGKKLNDSGYLNAIFTVENRLGSRRTMKDPYDATMPCRRCLYVWRDGVPQWGGIIWTRRYDSRTQQIQIGCGDFWSYFDHRKVLPVLALPVAPKFDIAELVVSYTAIEQNTIARNLVALAQSHTGGNIGIVADTSTSLINRDRTYRGYENQNVGEALRQLANVLNGPDMIFDIGKTLDAQGRPSRLFLQGGPRLGQQGSPWVWEYGGNMSDYTWPSDGSRFASRVFAAGEGSVEGTPIAVSEGTTLYTAWPLMERETAYTTVSDDTTLQGHADSDQLASQRPVALPQLEVRGNMRPIVGEWGLGDDARIVIVDGFHTNGLDTAMRIVATDITPPDQGADEQVLLTMGPLLDDIA